MELKYYVCGYSKGEYENKEDIDVFITTNLETAKKWIDKIEYFKNKVIINHLYLKENIENYNSDRFCKWINFNYAYYFEIDKI